jgi:transaldolase
MDVIRELVVMIENYDLDSEVLTASVRHPRHVTEAALIGSHIATLPFKVLQQMVHHPLTDKGIKTFREDWDKARKAADAKAADAKESEKEAAAVGSGSSARQN